MARHILILSVIAATASPAFGQDMPVASPTEIAQASATADRLIAAAQAGDFFTNVTTSALAEVRHTASGLRCIFDGGPEDKIMIFPSAVPRGDDVGCVTRDEALDIDLTLYATRYPVMPSEADVIAGTEIAIKARFQDARPFEGPIAAATAEGQPRPEAVAYHVTMNGKPKITMALVSNRGEWGFKARATGPDEQDGMMISLYASMLFSGATLPFGENPANPAAAAVD